MSPVILWALSVWAVLTFSGWGPLHFTHTPLTGLLTYGNDTQTDLTDNFNFKAKLSPLWRLWVTDQRSVNEPLFREKSPPGFHGGPDNDWKNKNTAAFRQVNVIGMRCPENTSELPPLSFFIQTNTQARMTSNRAGVEGRINDKNVHKAEDYTRRGKKETNKKTNSQSQSRDHRLPTDISFLMISLFCFIVVEAHQARRYGIFSKITGQRANTDTAQISFSEIADRLVDCDKEKLIEDEELKHARNNLLGIHLKLLSLQMGCPPPPNQASVNSRPTAHRRILRTSPENPDRSTSRMGFSQSWYKIRAVTKPPAQPEVSLRRRQRRFGPLAIDLPHGD